MEILISILKGFTIYLTIMHIFQEWRNIRIATLITASNLKGFLKANDVPVFELKNAKENKPIEKIE